MASLFTNNAEGLLSAGISAVAVTAVLNSGQGALFPAPTGGDFAMLTIFNAGGTTEIVKLTARTSDTLTIVRGQEGTTASAFLTGDKVDVRITAAGLANKLDKDTGGTVAAIAVTNNATVGGTLGVTGAATVGGLLTATGGMTGLASSATALAVARTISTTGDVTVTTGGFNGTANVTGVAAISANAVTLAQMAQFATNGLMGNNSGAASNPLLLTVAQATALLNAVVGDSGAGGTKGLVPAPSVGDGALGKMLSAAGVWSAPVVALTASNPGLITFQFGGVKLTLQWGTYGSPISSEQNISITFPHAFATSGLMAWAGGVNTNVSNNRDMFMQRASAVSASGCSFYAQGGYGSNNLDGFDWFALGVD